MFGCPLSALHLRSRCIYPLDGYIGALHDQFNIGVKRVLPYTYNLTFPIFLNTAVYKNERGGVNIPYDLNAALADEEG